MRFKQKYKTAKAKGEDRVLTCWARAAWPTLFEPKKMGEDGKLKYSIVLLFDEERVDISAIHDLVKRTAQAKWGKKLPKNLHLPFRDGSEEKEEIEAFDGMTFVTASSQFAPGIVDADRVEIIDQTEVYSGIYVRCTLNAYAYTYMNKNGVSLGLHNVQKLADGEHIGGGRVSAEDDFDDEDGGDDDDIFT